MRRPLAYILLLLTLLLASLALACGPARRGGGGDDDNNDELLGENNGTSAENNNAATDPDPDPGEDPCGDDLEAAAMELLNEERERAGLQTLSCDARILDVARAHSEDMVERDFFDHTNPDDEQPWDRLERGGVTRWTSVGENIAAGQRTAAEVHNGWMNSPGHRANILTPEFTHASIGIARDDDGTILWTQVFVTF